MIHYQKMNDVNGIIMKIVINHFQRVTLLFVFSIDITSIFDIQSFYDLFKLLSFLTEDLFSNDCFIQYFSKEPNDFYKLKVLMTLFLPVLFSLFCLFIFFCLNRIRSIKFLKTSGKLKKNPSHISCNNQIILTLLIALFLFYPLIIKCSFSLLNCVKIDNITDESFLYDSPNFKCWENDHLLFLIVGGIVGILFWGTIFPVYLSWVIKKNKEQFGKKRIDLQ